MLGNKIDVASAASEDELRHALGLASSITGKGKQDLKERPDVRPLEIFMCSVVRAPAATTVALASALQASAADTLRSCPGAAYGLRGRLPLGVAIHQVGSAVCTGCSWD